MGKAANAKAARSKARTNSEGEMEGCRILTGVKITTGAIAHRAIGATKLRPETTRAVRHPRMPTNRKPPGDRKTFEGKTKETVTFRTKGNEIFFILSR